MTSNELLIAALEVSVPLRIEELSESSFETRKAMATEAVKVIAEHGDDILYRSKKKGGSARAFNALTNALAVLAYQPGGVKFAGLHFEVNKT